MGTAVSACHSLIMTRAPSPDAGNTLNYSAEERSPSTSAGRPLLARLAPRRFSTSSGNVSNSSVLLIRERPVSLGICIDLAQTL